MTRLLLYSACFLVLLISAGHRRCHPEETNQSGGSEFPIVDRALFVDGKKMLICGAVQLNKPNPDQMLLFPIRNSANKWGYINTVGDVILPPQFDNIGTHMSDGLLAIQMSGKWGFINEYGHIAIPLQYDYARTFSNGVAVVSTNKKQYSERYEVIDTKGNTIIPPEFSEVHNFVDGVAWVREESDLHNVGVIDKKGNIVLPYGKYGNTEKHIHWFSEGKCFVRTGRYDPMGRDGVPSCYFVDTIGNIIINNDDIESATFFDHGVCFVRVEGKWGLIDLVGKWLVEPKYTACYSVNEDFSTIVRYCDVAPTYARTRDIGRHEELPFVKSFIEDLSLVEKDGRFGYLDYHGNEIIKPQYEHADFFSEGLAAVEVKGKYGYIDKANKIVIKPKFDQASYFSEGIAPVKINNKYGCINKQGRIIIKPRYEYIDIFRNGLAIFYQGQKWGYINHAGNEVWSGTVVNTDDAD